jgi:hypothetical protein
VRTLILQLGRTALRFLGCILAIGTSVCVAASPFQVASQNRILTERAYQDREILYELQSPESHAFRITHDYTVRNAGEKFYFNIVRAGSHVSEPESIDLDSGEKLKFEIVSAKVARERRLPVLELQQDIPDDTEIVVTYLARPLASGTTNRIRLKGKSWCGTAPSAACVIRWCCRLAGT